MTMASDLAREALEPFAKEAANYDFGDGSGPDTQESPDAMDLYGMMTDITVGDLRRARTAYDAIGAGVEALEWRDVTVNYGPETYEAESHVGHFQVFTDEDSASGAVLAEWSWDQRHFGRTEAKSIGRYPDFDEAKAAAQADFERRVLSYFSTHTAAGSDDAVTCERCQGNGEIVTDWDRYRHPHEGDVGDEAVAECPDCSGEGTHTAGAGPVGEANQLLGLVVRAQLLVPDYHANWHADADAALVAPSDPASEGETALCEVDHCRVEGDCYAQAIGMPEFCQKTERNDYLSDAQARELFGIEDDETLPDGRVRVCDGEWVRIPVGYYFDKSAGLLHPETADEEACDSCTVSIARPVEEPGEVERQRGWIYFNPDAGTEWSENHPVESGEVRDAEDIRPGTSGELLKQLLAAWRDLTTETLDRKAADAALAETRERLEKVEGLLANTDLQFRSIRYHADNGHQDRPLHVRLGMISQEANEALAALTGDAQEASPMEKLGKFGWHPDPVIDFEVEIEKLESRFDCAIRGTSKPGEEPEALQAVCDSIQRAMTFKAGGTVEGVVAKNRLRELERRVRTCLSTHTAAGAEPVGEAVAWAVYRDGVRIAVRLTREDAWAFARPNGDQDVRPLYPRPVEEPGEVERLRAEGFALAANQCRYGYGDEHGHHRCAEIDRLTREVHFAKAALAETRERLEKLLAAVSKARTALAGFTSIEDAAFALDIAIALVTRTGDA